jgi:hexosaminidase
MNLGSIMKLLNTAPFPSMDPSKESTYQFIDKFIAEMCTLFPAGYIHIGADENNGVAWKNNPAIVAFMKAHDMQDTHALQAYFVKRVNEIITKHHKQMIGWEELFSKDLAKDATVQVWQNSAYIKQALEKGNPVLISKGFYLDLFMPAYVHYNNPDLSSLPALNSSQLRGGEAAQWTEIADKTNIETRIWPRAAAVAEKLWSSASDETSDLYRRLFTLSDQLDERGIQHIADYERALRRYASDRSQLLQTLTDVLTPVKGYKRLFAQMMMPESMSYQSAPLIQISDIVPVDSKVKWAFRAAVKSYLEHRDTISENLIRKYLVLWRDNNAQLQPLFADCAALRRVEEHSKNLSVVATIGLNALKQLKDGVTDLGWPDKQRAILNSANQAFGETELCIIPEIEALVNANLEPLPSSYPVF